MPAASIFLCKFLYCESFVLKIFVLKTFVLKTVRLRAALTAQAMLTRQTSLTRSGAPVDTVGNWPGIVGDTFNQFDDFRPLLG